MRAQNARGGVILNTRSLAVFGAFLLALCIFIPVNAEPKLKINSLSDELQRQDSGRHLALGHYKDKKSFFAFPDKGEKDFSVALGHVEGFEHLYGYIDSVNTPAATTPEPATMLLLGSGLIGLVGIIRKKHQRIR